MYFLLDCILSVIVVIISLIFLIIPVRFGLFIGRLAGGLVYYLNKRRRSVAYSNMKAAFKGEKSPEEIDRLIKNMYKNFGEVFIEVLTLPRINKNYLQKNIEVKNIERIDDALAHKKGVIFLTAHFGNWELVSIVSALKGYPLSVLAREQKMKILNSLLNYYRQMKGCKVVKKGMATREIFKDLKDNKLIGVLSDQDAGKRGTFVNFFGRPTSFAAGVVNLAAETGAVILPTFIVRSRGPKHIVFIEKPLPITRTGKKFEDEKMHLQSYADILESYVRKYPDSWLWVHKRWKSTTQKTILILNDGKQGHLNQSKRVLDELVKLRLARGCKEADTIIKIIDIAYKNNFLKTLTLAASLCPFLRTSRKIFKLSLKEDSYKKLTVTYADLIISAGSSLVPANIFAKADNNARNIAIMDPGFLSRKFFNVCIIPEHDRVKESHNVIVTKGALNNISSKRLEEDAKKLSARVALSGKSKIGLLIGGSNENFILDADIIEKVLNEIKDIDADILVTTSRRTSKEVEMLLKEKLKGFKNCRLLVIANEENFEFALTGIMGLSDIIIVSGDSSSMVSEAASSGKNVLVFEPKVVNKNNKHTTFLKNFDEEGIINLTDIPEIKNKIEILIKNKIIPLKFDDSPAILKAVERFV